MKVIEVDKIAKDGTYWTCFDNPSKNQIVSWTIFGPLAQNGSLYLCTVEEINSDNWHQCTKDGGKFYG